MAITNVDAVEGETLVKGRIHTGFLNPIACGSGRRRIRHVPSYSKCTWRWQPDHEFVELEVHRFRPLPFRNLKEFDCAPWGTAIPAVCMINTHYCERLEH